MDRNVKIALVLAATDRASAVMAKALANTERHARHFENVGKSFGKIGDQALVAGGLASAFFLTNILDAEEAEAANRRLEQVFKSMGKTTMEAANHVSEFADRMQFRIAIDDEQIKNVGAKFATFRSIITDQAIAGGILDRSIAAAFDMQATGFGEAANNAVQLGKALEDPIQGINSLRRSGISFTALEKERLKFLVQTNQKFQAQQIILKAVEQQVGGVAAATAKSSDIMRLQWGEASESLGRALLPAFKELTVSVQEHTPKVLSFVERNKSAIITVAKLAVGMLAFGGAMKVVSFGLSGVSTAFKIIGGGLQLTKGILGFGRSALEAGQSLSKLQTVGLKIGGFLKNLGPIFRTAGMAVMRFGLVLLASPITWYVAAAVALGAAVYLIIRNWGGISKFFSGIWQKVKSAFVTFWNWAKNFFFNYTPHGIIIKYWDRIPEMFSVIWDRVKGVFTGAWDWLAGLGGRFFEAGKNIVKSIARGIVQVAMLPVQAMMGIVQKIRNYLPFSPAKEGPLRDIHRIRLVETIAQGITAKPMIQAWSGAMGQFRNQIARPIPVRGGSSPTFSLTVNLSGGATQQDANRVLDTFKAEADRWWAQKQHNMSRLGFQNS